MKSIERPELRIRWKSEGENVILEIEDNGAGIASDDRTKIFDAFFTTKPGGTGLGLYVCKLIVEDSHGGKIEAKSRPGKGSVFSVFLPRQQ